MGINDSTDRVRHCLALLGLLCISACQLVGGSLPIDEQTLPTPQTDQGLAPPDYDYLLGASFPPLPDGIQSGFSQIIQFQDPTEWALHLVSDGDNQMLWLSHKQENSQVVITWILSDILLIQDLDGTYVLIPDGCSIGDEAIPGLVALARLESDDSNVRFLDAGQIDKAFQVNTQTGYFEEVPSTDVSCWLDLAINLLP